MSTTAALEARLRALEGENQSLSAAASEAASIAEEYAADAAAYRRLTSASPQLTELSDAARRKDRRITRLLSLLDAEKAHVADLKQHLLLADDMARTLRATVAQLTFRTSTPTLLPLLHALLRLFANYLPPSSPAHADVDAVAAIPVAVSLLHLLPAVRKHVAQNPREYGTHHHTILDLLLRAAHAVFLVFRWGFERPPCIQERAAHLLSHLTALHDRARVLAAELADPPTVASWTEAIAVMKLDLVGLEVDRLQALVGTDNILGAEESDQIDVDLLVSEVLATVEERARGFASSFGRSGRGVEGQQQEIATLKTSLAAAKGLIQRREAEIEDMKIRAAVFEEHMEARRNEMKELRLVKQRAAEVQQQLESERAKSAIMEGRNSSDNQLDVDEGPDSSSAAIAEQAGFRENDGQCPTIVEKNEPPLETRKKDGSDDHVIEVADPNTRAVDSSESEDMQQTPSRGGGSGAVVSSNENISLRELKTANTDKHTDQVPLYLDRIDEAKEAARLRHILVRRQLADLQSGPSTLASLKEEASLNSNDRQVRDKVRIALRNAREAASNAQVVRLDAETLQPKTRGATMSRKQLLQAKALAKKFFPDASAEQEKRIPDGAAKLELKLHSEHEDAHIITSALRQLLCP